MAYTDAPVMDDASFAEREQVMLHTCFPGGVYDGTLAECRAFSGMIKREAGQ